MKAADHKLIALALKRDRERGGKNDRLIEFFALLLEQDNSRFKRKWFFEKCAYSPETDNGQG